MVGAGDDEAAIARRRARMRASDVEREAVVDALKAAYVHGLVAKDEFDERVSLTLTSRTRAELALITGDIPADLAAAPPLLSRARANAGPGDAAIGGAAVLTALLFVAAFFAAGPLAQLLALGATASALVSLFLAAVQVRSSRRDKLSGGQFPPQPGIETEPRARQLPQAGEPGRRSPADAARRRSLRPGLST